jgi:ABC-type bacteriocin/lantibiotic exporter with double-glycine peptidase domain
MIIAGFCRLIVSASMVGYPLLLQQLLIQLQSPNPDFGAAYGWACGLGTSMFISAIFGGYSLWLTSRAGWQMRSAVCSEVYQKSLRLSNASRQSKTIGEIVNYMQLDANKIALCTDQIHALWDAPIQVVAFTIVLYFIIGWYALAFRITYIALM